MLQRHLDEVADRASDAERAALAYVLGDRALAPLFAARAKRHGDAATSLYVGTNPVTFMREHFGDANAHSLSVSSSSSASSSISTSISSSLSTSNSSSTFLPLSSSSTSLSSSSSLSSISNSSTTKATRAIVNADEYVAVPKIDGESFLLVQLPASIVASIERARDTTRAQRTAERANALLRSIDAVHAVASRWRATADSSLPPPCVAACASAAQELIDEPSVARARAAFCAAASNASWSSATTVERTLAALDALATATRAVIAASTDEQRRIVERLRSTMGDDSSSPPRRGSKRSASSSASSASSSSSSASSSSSSASSSTLTKKNTDANDDERARVYLIGRGDQRATNERVFVLRDGVCVFDQPSDTHDPIVLDGELALRRVTTAATRDAERRRTLAHFVDNDDDDDDNIDENDMDDDDMCEDTSNIEHEDRVIKREDQADKNDDLATYALAFVVADCLFYCRLLASEPARVRMTAAKALVCGIDPARRRPVTVGDTRRFDVVFKHAMRASAMHVLGADVEPSLVGFAIDGIVFVRFCAIFYTHTIMRAILGATDGVSSGCRSRVAQVETTTLAHH